MRTISIGIVGNQIHVYSASFLSSLLAWSLLPSLLGDDEDESWNATAVAYLSTIVASVASMHWRVLLAMGVLDTVTVKKMTWLCINVSCSTSLGGCPDYHVEIAMSPCHTRTTHEWPK
jgi:hypothetical protein